MSAIETVACYCRVSTENQIENYSIDEQRERLEAFCKARGWAKPVMFTDPGFSGGTLERPALREMLEQVRAGKFSVVCVYKLDRLSRSQKDTLYLIEDVFNRFGVSFVSVCENFDTSTPFGKAMVGILSVFAQLEKDQITERFTMGRIGRAKNGLFHGGGNPPTGYDYIGGRLVVNEYQAQQVRDIFSLFAQGQSVHAIMRIMSEKYGGWSSHTTIYNILKNSIYIGKVKFAGTEYDGEHEPLITPEAFYETQRLLSERSDGMTAAQKTPFRAGFMLSGLVFCGNCGARYHGNHGCYKCYSRAKSDKKYIVDPDCRNPNMGIAELDDMVRAEIAHAAIDPSVILNRSPAAPVRDARASLNSRLADVKEQSNRLIALYQAAGIPLESVTGRLRELEAERAHLEKQLAELPHIVIDRRREWVELLSRWEESMSDTDTAARRSYVASLIQKITVMPDKSIVVEWRT